MIVPRIDVREKAGTGQGVESWNGRAGTPLTTGARSHSWWEHVPLCRLAILAHRTGDLRQHEPGAGMHNQ